MGICSSSSITRCRRQMETRTLNTVSSAAIIGNKYSQQREDTNLVDEEDIRRTREWTPQSRVCCCSSSQMCACQRTTAAKDAKRKNPLTCSSSSGETPFNFNLKEVVVVAENDNQGDVWIEVLSFENKCKSLAGKDTDNFNSATTTLACCCVCLRELHVDDEPICQVCEKCACIIDAHHACAKQWWDLHHRCIYCGQDCLSPEILCT